MPNTDVALNDIFDKHSVSLKPPEAPLYGGALTSEPKKAKKGGAAAAASSPTLITTDNVNAALPAKKGKGPTAPLISNIAAIHRGLAPYVDASTGQISLRNLQRYLGSLVPPEHEADAMREYIRPYLKHCAEELARLQGPNAAAQLVAGAAGAEAEDALNQTSASLGNVDTQSNAGDVNDAASTVGGRSVRAASRAGTTIRAPSVHGGVGGVGSSSVAGSMASRAPSPGAGYNRHPSPSTASIGGGGANGRLFNNNTAASTAASASQAAAQQQRERERQEELFFNTGRLPYSHVVACLEELLKPHPPVSNMVPDEISGALLSARVCFLLCDPLGRGYITADSVKAMRSDQSTNEDYTFNVVQGLSRAMGILEALEAERFAMIAKKARKGKKSKKPVPMPTVRQFHMSLDEFTHLLSTDAYLPLAFLPYILKTLINGRRQEIAAVPVAFYGRSQVAHAALQRANYREKRAAEANMSRPLVIDDMTAAEIAERLERRQYPPIVSSLAAVPEHDSVSGGGATAVVVLAGGGDQSVLAEGKRESCDATAGEPAANGAADPSEAAAAPSAEGASNAPVDKQPAARSTV